MGGAIPDIAGRFAVLGQAAKGGMGVVYQAQDRETGTLVAVKVMLGSDRDSAARFVREADILAGLTHPAIVRYIAHGTTPDGKPFLAMDWVEGETLHSRLERTGLSIGETVELGRRVAGALGYAHERGIIHRDIKPTNLILPDRDLSRVAILDFGVARAPTAGSLTETGAVVGTPAYMSPEQARGERQLDPRTDVFALGCVLYECLTGRRAFEGKHVLALIAKVVLWDPPRVLTVDPEIPEELDAAIVRMLSKEPARRPRDGSAVVTMLEAVPEITGPGRRGRTGAATTAVIRRGGLPAIDTHAPTIATNPRIRLASIVVASPPASDEPVGEDDAPAPAPVVDATVIEAVRKVEPLFEVLHDGSILAVVTDQPNPADLAARALRCARAVRRAAPEALIAVATGEISDGDPMAETIATLLEDTVGALAREAMAMLFAGVATARPEGAIRVDERTAGLIAEAVIRIKTACYVRSES